MSNVLRATPSDEIADSGPSWQPGCILTGVTILCALIGLVMVIGALVETESSGPGLLAVGLVFLLPLVYIIARSLSGRRNSTARIAGIDVLREVLHFNLPPNSNNVGLTAFFRPGEVNPGFPTTFMLALQNYSSRRRTVEMQFPRIDVLGELSGRVLYFYLEPGQAAIYRHPLIISRDAIRRRYFLKVKLRVELPTGAGSRIIPRSKKDPSVIATHTRALSVLLDVAEPERYTEAPTISLASPQYLSVFSPNLPEPRFELLERLTQASADETIPVNR